MVAKLSTALSARRRTAHAWLQMAPAAAYFGALFIAPLAILAAYSFFRFEDYRFIPAFSLENYREVLTSGLYTPYLVRTILLSLAIAVVVLLLAYPFAYALTFVFPRRRQLLYFLVLVSLFGGYLVRIYAWRTMLGREGLVNDALMTAGLTSHPLGFFLNSEIAIVITLVNFYLPLGILPIYAAMQNVPARLMDAAHDLGSGRWHAARRVLLPMTMQGITAAFAFVFIASAAEWVTPLLVGGPDDQFFGNQIVREFGTELNWPLGAAMAVTLILSSLAVVAVVLGVVRRLTR